jgi:hypothetical protein
MPCAIVGLDWGGKVCIIYQWLIYVARNPIRRLSTDADRLKLVWYSLGFVRDDVHWLLIVMGPEIGYG